jgi:hypothetical protein
MEVHQARIRLPPLQQFLGILVVQRTFPPQPLLQVVPCPDIVGRKDIEAPTAAKENIFRRPATNATQLHQSFAGCCIIKVCEGLVLELSPGSSDRDFADGQAFGTAEAEGLQQARVNTGENLRPGKGLPSSLLGWSWRPAEYVDKPVKKCKASLQAELLARDSVNQSFEYRRELRWSHASKPICQIIERGPRGCHSIEPGEVNTETKHVVQHATHCCLDACTAARARYTNAEPRCIVEPDLCRGESYGDSTNMDRPPVYGTVPAIQFVYRTAAKRPNRQIQSEGWPDRDDEGTLVALPRGIVGKSPSLHG